MAKKAGKHVENARKKVEARPYKLADAAELLKKTHHTKFNETVDLALRLGVAESGELCTEARRCRGSRDENLL